MHVFTIILRNSLVTIGSCMGTKLLHLKLTINGEKIKYLTCLFSSS